MSVRLVSAVLFLALPVALPAQAQEKFTLKFSRSKQGDTVLVEKVEKTDSKILIVDNDDKVTQEVENKKLTHHAVFRETILDKAEGAKKATKLTRHYLKALEVVNGAAEKRPYQGKTVIIEKKEGKYHFVIEGGMELTGEDAEQLEKEFNKNDSPGSEMKQLFGEGKTVGVGETWPLELALLQKIFGGGSKMVLDPKTTKATATLVKAYKKDGHQFGVLKIDLLLVVRAISANGKEVAVEPGSKITMKAEVDVCIDGSIDLGSVTLQGEANITMRYPDMPLLRLVVANKGDLTGHFKVPPK